MQKYHDQYLKVLGEDRTRFCDRVGDAGGGQYVINVKHIFTELASATGISSSQHSSVLPVGGRVGGGTLLNVIPHSTPTVIKLLSDLGYNI